MIIYGIIKDNGICILFLSQDLTVRGTIVSLNGIKKKVDLRIRLHIILQNIKLNSISYMLYVTYVKKKYDTGRQYYLVSKIGQV